MADKLDYDRLYRKNGLEFTLRVSRYGAGKTVFYRVVTTADNLRTIYDVLIALHGEDRKSDVAVAVMEMLNYDRRPQSASHIKASDWFEVCLKQLGCELVKPCRAETSVPNKPLADVTGGQRFRRVEINPDELMPLDTPEVKSSTFSEFGNL